MDVIFDDGIELDSFCFLIRRSSSDDLGLDEFECGGGGGGGVLIDWSAEADDDCFIAWWLVSVWFDCIAWNKHDCNRSCCCLIKSVALFDWDFSSFSHCTGCSLGFLVLNKDNLLVRAKIDLIRLKKLFYLKILAI